MTSSPPQVIGETYPFFVVTNIDFISLNFEEDKQKKIEQLFEFFNFQISYAYNETYNTSYTSNTTKDVIVSNIGQSKLSNSDFFQTDFAPKLKEKDKFEKIVYLVKDTRSNRNQIRLTGENAAFFFKLCKKNPKLRNLISEYFQNVTRLDVVACKTVLQQEFNCVSKFLENCRDLVKQSVDKRLQINLINNVNGVILKLGKRSSSNFYRIYCSKKKLKLRFELELKKRTIKDLSKLFLGEDLELFETTLKKVFYTQTYKWFHSCRNLDSNYFDWLWDYFRKETVKGIIKNQNQKGLLFPYISESMEGRFLIDRLDIETMYLFSYFMLATEEITFINNQEETYYYEITFILNNYLNFRAVPLNSHQKLKLYNFFEELVNLSKNNSLFFLNKNYTKYLEDIKIEILNSNGVKQSTKVYFKFPEKLLICFRYFFPISFSQYADLYEKRVIYFLVDSFCVTSVNKLLNIDKLFTSLPSSNSRRKKIILLLLKKIILLFELKIIDSSLKLILWDNSGESLELLKTEFTYKKLKQVKFLYVTEYIDISIEK